MQISDFEQNKSNKMSCVSATSQYLFTRGHVQLILGPMFSGKTTELLRRIKRFKVANHACLVVKYANDDRYSNQDVCTHDQVMTTGISATQLDHIKTQAFKFSVIGIDEGQFFPDIVPFCEEMANAGKTVIVAALDGTFQRKPFGQVLNLVPLSESVVKLKAVCMVCYKDAAFSKRLGSEQEIEVIGGSDKYMAVCRTCYNLPDTPTLLPKESTPPASFPTKEITPTRGTELTVGNRQLFSDDIYH